MRTRYVPDLPAGASLVCVVGGHVVGQPASSSTLGSVALVAASPVSIAFPTVPPALITQLRLRNGRIETLPAPHITPGVGVGVGATNTCTPGTWSHYPAFTYSWYAFGARIPGKLVRSRTLLARAQTLTLAPSDEKLDIACFVTATNRAGSDVAATNDSVVFVEATETIDTYGQNCEDYQKYWMGQRYSVKQQPGDGP
jgi:hypothetical protein